MTRSLVTLTFVGALKLYIYSKQAFYFKLLYGTSLLGVGEVIIGALTFLVLLAQQRDANSLFNSIGSINP